MTALNRAEIIEELKPLLVSASNGRARLDHLAEDSLIIEDVGLASLDLLELRFELEARFDATLTDEETIALKTIGDVVNIIVQKTGG
jgi:acyl carrier protein